MDDFRCPHCRNGHLQSGTCTECGWSISIAASERPRAPSTPTQVAFGPSYACWFLLPLAGAVIDFFGPIAFLGTNSDFFGVLTTGSVAAQFGLLAIVAALGPGRHAKRLLATFAIAAVLLLVLIVGVAIGDRGTPSASDVGGAFLMLPALLLAAQAPLWLFRALTGRWMRSSAPASMQKMQFGIAQMMWATALVAVAMALARGALVLSRPESGLIPARQLTFFVARCGMLAVLSGLVAVPSTLAVLVARNPGGPVMLVFGYAILLTIALLALINVAGGLRPTYSADFVVMFGATILATFGGILAGLAVVRQCGYTMYRQ